VTLDLIGVTGAFLADDGHRGGFGVFAGFRDLGHIPDVLTNISQNPAIRRLA
jgi:hypothetical protein